MHAATDGMYLRGYSGYPTPIDYFIDVTKKLLKTLDGDLNVVVKPHPNLLMGSLSAYKSHHEKAEKEREYYDHILKNYLLRSVSEGVTQF